MKSILILDEMPECCEKCRVMDAGNPNLCKGKTFKTPKGNEFFYQIDDISKKPEWCPLKPLCDMLIKAFSNCTPLPKGHGRLIDADALEKKMCNREEELGDDKALWESSAVSVALSEFAPTIIEADEELENENNISY